MAQADVTYRFRGDSSDLEAAGRQAQAALDATAREATAASAKVGASFDHIASKAGTVGQSAKKLRGALGALSPELANLAGAVDDTADVFEVLGTMGGGVAAMAAGLTAGLAALGAAYVAVTTDIERQNEARRQEHELALSLIEVNRDIESVQLELAAAYGVLTDAQLKQAQAALAARSAVLDNAESHREEKQALRESIEATEKWKTALNALPFSDRGVNGAMVDFVFGVDESREALERIAEQEADYAAQQKSLRQLTQELTQATHENKSANDARNVSLKRTSDLQQQIQDELDALYTSYENQKKQTEERTNKRNAELQAEIDAIDNQRRLEQQHADWRRQQEEEAQALREKGTVASADAWARLGEDVKEYGRIGFGVWKATALSEIAVNTIVAATRALAELGPIAGPLAAVAISASGTIAAGKVAAEQPVFDMGGVKRTDREMAVVRKGESVLTERGTAAVVDAINRGDLGGGSGSAPYTILDHRAYARHIRDEVRIPSTLGSAITGARSTLPGRRPRRAA